MKENITRHCIAFCSALLLAGCGLISDANAVKDPTVDQMAGLEKQWGLKPRETRTRMMPAGDPTPYNPAPELSPAPPTNTVPLPDPPPPSLSVPTETPSIPPSLR